MLNVQHEHVSQSRWRQINRIGSSFLECETERKFLQVSRQLLGTEPAVGAERKSLQVSRQLLGTGILHGNIGHKSSAFHRVPRAVKIKIRRLNQNPIRTLVLTAHTRVGPSLGRQGDIRRAPDWPLMKLEINAFYNTRPAKKIHAWLINSEISGHAN